MTNKTFAIISGLYDWSKKPLITPAIHRLTFAVFSNFFGLDEVINFQNCFCTEYTFLWNFDIVIEFDFSFLQSCQDF